ncbi:MAG: hypothetical protein ACI92E_000687 [Oceanicoccus sp.]|jgi:hypothetical protein
MADNHYLLEVEVEVEVKPNTPPNNNLSCTNFQKILSIVGMTQSEIYLFVWIKHCGTISAIVLVFFCAESNNTNWNKRHPTQQSYRIITTRLRYRTNIRSKA